MAIARALINDPAIVFADEPTGDLDKRTANDVFSLLRQLNEEQDQTFVIVTHDPRWGPNVTGSSICGTASWSARREW